MIPNVKTDWLGQWKLYSPQAVAFFDVASDQALTYGELYNKSQVLAQHLAHNYNIQKGQRVAVMAPNLIEWMPLFFALQRLGAILVPVNFRLTTREVKHIVDDSGAQLFIHHTDFQGIVENINVQLWSFNGPDGLQTFLKQNLTVPHLSFAGEFTDPVMILYTSGTTGQPKGAIITHQMLFWNSINTGLRLNLQQSDVTLCFLPLFHTGGWNVLTTPFLHRGARLVFMEKFDGDQVLKLCEQEKVTVLFGVPTTMDMMARSKLFKEINLSSVRYAIVGGEPMPLELIKIWHKKGIPIRQGYGLTEFGPNVFSLNEQDALRKMGSIGFPNFYIETKVVNNEDQECVVNQVGELLLKGPMCMQGYWNQPEATAQTIKDGWLHTGDLVRYDDEGYFYVVGRKKEMYISGGENVYPVEVEQILRQHPLVKEAAVIGTPDTKWGEVGHAFLAVEEQLDTQIFAEYCRQHLAKFKIPKYFTLLGELPKGDSGKILKKKLAELPVPRI